MHNDINWENFRYVLHVAQTGSIAAAAKELGVNRTTVLRRINQFEADLDFKLFDRMGSGYAIAPGAEQLLDAAKAVGKTIDELQRRVLGKEIQLEGSIRVTTTDSLSITVVTPHLETFRQEHPLIQLELVVSNHQLNLTRRDADVAIRPGKNKPANLAARKLGVMTFGLYASSAYLGSHTAGSFVNHRWIGMDNPIAQSPPGIWFSDRVPADNICIKADSFITMMAMAETGMGIALLPNNLARTSAGLKKAPLPQPDLTNNIWAMTHPDLQRAARINAFMSHMEHSVNSLELI